MYTNSKTDYAIANQRVIYVGKYPSGPELLNCKILFFLQEIPYKSLFLGYFVLRPVPAGRCSCSLRPPLRTARNRIRWCSQQILDYESRARARAREDEILWLRLCRAVNSLSDKSALRPGSLRQAQHMAPFGTTILPEVEKEYTPKSPGKLEMRLRRFLIVWRHSPTTLFPESITRPMRLDFRFSSVPGLW